MWSDVFKGYRKRPRAWKGLIMKRISGTSSMVCKLYIKGYINNKNSKI